jgi:hypothetical protein
MFGLDKDEKLEEQKKKLEETLNDYRIRRKKEIEKAVANWRTELCVNVNNEVANLHKKCNKQINEYEHTFHQAQQDKQVILAKLDAQIEYKEKMANELEAKIVEKQELIDKLLDIIEKSVERNVVINK